MWREGVSIRDLRGRKELEGETQKKQSWREGTENRNSTNGEIQYPVYGNEATILLFYLISLILWSVQGVEQVMMGGLHVCSGSPHYIINYTVQSVTIQASV